MSSQEQNTSLNCTDFSARTFCMTMFAMLLLISFPTRANLIQATDPNFGPNSLTIDTQTGLAWLNVSASADLSYNQVIADMKPGGVFSGFRYATLQQVFGLYSDAGIPGLGEYPFSTPSIQSFLTMLNPSGEVNGAPGIIALSATPEDVGAQYAPGVYATYINGVPEYLVGAGSAYGTGTSYSFLGSWLVMNVPESADVLVYVLAGAGLLVFNFMVRGGRKPQANN